jgi:hypothetical protein
MVFLSVGGIVCPSYVVVLTGTIQAQIVSKVPQKDVINVGECARGYRFAAAKPCKRTGNTETRRKLGFSADLMMLQLEGIRRAPLLNSLTSQPKEPKIPAQ